MRDASTTTPLVSVVIPAYRAAQSIGATLDSVLHQTFEDTEILVVNDGSPDREELERVLERYGSRIIYLYQENQGPAGARNAGIRAARGKYIALLDSDDIWAPEHLASQVAALEADPTIDVIYADARIIGDVPEAGRTVMEFCPSTGEVTFERLVTQECTVHLCVSVCRRETLLRAGLFDPAFRGTEDIDMWLRIAAMGGRITYQRRVLGSYRRHAGSLSSDRTAMLEGFLSVLSKAARELPLSQAQRATVERKCAAERASLELQLGKDAFLGGDVAGSIAHLQRANAARKSLKLWAVLALLEIAPGFVRTLYGWRDRQLFKLKTPS